MVLLSLVYFCTREHPLVRQRRLQLPNVTDRFPNDGITAASRHCKQPLPESRTMLLIYALKNREIEFESAYK